MQRQDDPALQMNVAMRRAVQDASRAFRDRISEHRAEIRDLIAGSHERIATSRYLLDRTRTYDPSTGGTSTMRRGRAR